jgi:hypothetical protein
VFALIIVVIIPFFMFNSFGISYKYIKDQNVI